jgi:RNA polymerase sigma-70 factor (ECF subfamily)
MDTIRSAAGQRVQLVEGLETLDPAIDEFESFWLSQHRRLLRLSYALTGSTAAAEDLVQETMLRVLKHWRTVRAADHPDAWARRVLVNLATSRGRRLVREARGMIRLRAEHRTAPTPSVEVTNIIDAIRRLPRHEAQVVALHYLDDMSVQAIAEVLGCPENTVKTRLRRGRLKLAGLLRDDEEN